MPDPYQSPALEGDESSRGLPCKECGSVNTTTRSFSQRKLGVVGVIFFGWIYLLIKGAFAKRTSRCRDCGATHRFKSVGSWIALAVLVVICLLVLLAIFY